MVVVDRLERLFLPMESLLHRGGMGRSWASVSTPDISGVDCKNKHERRKREKDI